MKLVWASSRMVRTLNWAASMDGTNKVQRLPVGTNLELKLHEHGALQECIWLACAQTSVCCIQR